MCVPGHSGPGGCVRRVVGLCQCESGSGASLDACAMSVARCQSSGVGRLSDAWRRTPATDPGPSFDGLSDRVMWSCEGLAAPVIGGEGSEALCERLIGSGGATVAQAIAVRRGSRQSCDVRSDDTAGSSSAGFGRHGGCF